MSSDPGVIIAKRSLSLSKTYAIVGAFLAFISVLVASIPSIMSAFPSKQIPTNNETGSLTFQSTFPLVSIPLQVFAAIAFTTPVLLLYVYDKNNGVLEYFLSLGMDQGDIYRRYLKASLLLAAGLLAFEVIINFGIGLVERANFTLLSLNAGIVVLIALPVVSFVALLMMAFSSLQKQRVGSNQPLGIAIGIFTVMPAYIAPLILPSIAVFVDLFLAITILILSVVMYFLSSRLISREKLLP